MKKEISKKYIIQDHEGNIVKYEAKLKVSKFGTGGGVIIPKALLGKYVIVKYQK